MELQVSSHHLDQRIRQARKSAANGVTHDQFAVTDSELQTKFGFRIMIVSKAAQEYARAFLRAEKARLEWKVNKSSKEYRELLGYDIVGPIRDLVAPTPMMSVDVGRMVTNSGRALLALARAKGLDFNKPVKYLVDGKVYSGQLKSIDGTYGQFKIAPEPKALVSIDGYKVLAADGKEPIMTFKKWQELFGHASKK